MFTRRRPIVIATLTISLSICGVGMAFAHSVWAKATRERAGVASIYRTHAPRSQTAPKTLQIYATRRARSDEATFAVLRTPRLATDAMPASITTLVPVTDARLARRIGETLIYIFKPAQCLPGTTRSPSCLALGPRPHGNTYCFAVVQPWGNNAACGNADTYSKPGAAMSSIGSNLVVGIVPDFVQRVRYGGNDVPIVNNVFVFEDAGPMPRPVIIAA